MKKQTLLIGGVIVAIVVVVMVLGSDDTGPGSGGTNAPEADPLDSTLSFYRSYLTAVRDASTDPYQEGVMEDAILSEDVREYAKTNRDNSLDPVLCQIETPEKVRAKSIFVNDTAAQVQVLARSLGEKVPEQAVVDLVAVDGQWKISKITCASGESAPAREFAFDQEGYILKSVPEPLDSRYWHLVFEQRGTMGHTVPLFFDAESVCVLLDGSEVMCDESTFEDATKAYVKGGMTEAGVEVKWMRLTDEE